VIVTGGRSYNKAEWVYAALDELIDKENDIVIHGDAATGVDAYTNNWCLKNNVMQERVPPAYNQYGSRAGRRKNQIMVAMGARLCIAFPILGVGDTWDCMRQAKEAGIMVINLGEKHK